MMDKNIPKSDLKLTILDKRELRVLNNTKQHPRKSDVTNNVRSGQALALISKKTSSLKTICQPKVARTAI